MPPTRAVPPPKGQSWGRELAAREGVRASSTPTCPGDATAAVCPGQNRRSLQQGFLFVPSTVGGLRNLVFRDPLMGLRAASNNCLAFSVPLPSAKCYRHCLILTITLPGRYHRSCFLKQGPKFREEQQHANGHTAKTHAPSPRVRLPPLGLGLSNAQAVRPDLSLTGEKT